MIGRILLVLFTWSVGIGIVHARETNPDTGLEYYTPDEVKPVGVSYHLRASANEISALTLVDKRVSDITSLAREQEVIVTPVGVEVKIIVPPASCPTGH